MILEKRGEKLATIVDGDMFAVIIKHNPDDYKTHWAKVLPQESGWYVLRQGNSKTGFWLDHAKPGYGMTYWLKINVAKNLGLI